MAAEQIDGAGGPGPERQKRRSLSAQINAERLAAQIARRRQSEMLLAKARGELVLRELVEKQAAFLLVSLRQEIMAAPGAWAPQLVGLKTAEEAAAMLRELTQAWLEAVADLPERVTDETWMERLAQEAAGEMEG